MHSSNWGALLAAAAVMCVAGAQPASAQGLGGLLFGKKGPMVDGKYRGGNTIRAAATDGMKSSPKDMFRLALTELARLSNEKGYPRFAIVKISDCGTMKINGISAAVSCRLVGRMLKEAEVAEPDGKNPITYFRTADVLAGRPLPEGS